MGKLRLYEKTTLACITPVALLGATQNKPSVKSSRGTHCSAGSTWGLGLDVLA